MQNGNNPPSSNTGLAVALLGGLAAVGGIAAAVAASGSRKPSRGLSGARRPLKLKKPCGCGR